MPELAVETPARVLPSPSPIREVLQAAAPGAVDLALGEPGHAPPAAALAVLRAARPEALRYTENAGLPELRAAVARARPLHGVGGASVLVTIGSQQALALTCLGLLGLGDEAVIAELGYPSYEALPRLAGGVVRRVRGEEIESALSERTRLVIVGSPANPTSRALAPERLAALAERAALCGARVVVDEIYAPLFDVASVAPQFGSAAAAERVVLVGGVSKGFALTGLRVGWLVAAPALVARLLPLHQHLVTCAPRLAQEAAGAALESAPTFLPDARSFYARLRRRALDGLAAIDGLAADDPGGGFYLWVDARPRLGRDTRAFALAAARAGTVLVVPGEAFGPAGAGFLRLSVAAGERAVAEGVGRLAAAIAEWAA